jgi:hypothetical protein
MARLLVSVASAVCGRAYTPPAARYMMISVVQTTTQ